MLEMIWTYLPIVMALFFLIYYKAMRLNIDFVAYYFFSIFPYFSFNENGIGNNQYIYTSIMLYFALFLILYGFCTLLVKGAILEINSLLLCFFSFVLYITVNGLLNHPTVNMYKGIRNIVFFPTVVLVLYWFLGKSIEEVKKVARINVLIMCACIIGQYIVSPWHALSIMNYVRYRCFFNDANTFAAVLLIYLYFATSGGISKKDIAYTLLSGISILFCWSTSGAFAFMIWIIDLKRIKDFVNKIRIYKCILFALIGIVVVLVLIRSLSPQIYNSMFQSQSDRMFLWAIYINAFFKNPLFGCGYTNTSATFGLYMNDLPYDPATYNIVSSVWENGGAIIAHNDLLRILADTGIVGFVFFLIFIGLMFKKANMQRVEKNLKMIMMGIVYLITHNYIQGYILWMMFFCVMLYEKENYCTRFVSEQTSSFKVDANG